MLKKKELLSEVAKVASTQNKVVEDVLTGLTTVVTSELVKGEKVVVPGLGTFTPKFVPGGPKTSRNPRTGEVTTKDYPDKTVVKIKPAKSLSDVLFSVKPVKK